MTGKTKILQNVTGCFLPFLMKAGCGDNTGSFREMKWGKVFTHPHTSMNEREKQINFREIKEKICSLPDFSNL